MKSGQALDADIAMKIMGLTITDPTKTPKFSSDVYAAHKVINRLQNQGWSCRVRSQINKQGILNYKAHFNKGKGLHSETVAPTVPLAVCLAALAIANEQYVEFVEKHDDDTPIEIAEPLPEAGLEEITMGDEPIINILAQAMENRRLPFNDKEGKSMSFKRLFFKLVIDGYMSREQQDTLPKVIADFFLDILKENNYLIVKKTDDS